MAKYLNEQGLLYVLAGLWARVNQKLAAISLTPGPPGPKGDTGSQGPPGDPAVLPPGVMSRRFLAEGEDFTLSIDEQQEYDDYTGLFSDKVVVSFAFHQDVNELDEYTACFQLDFSQEEDEGEIPEQRERAVYLSCKFSPHEPNAKIQLHTRNVWVLNELLGIDYAGLGGDLFALISLIGFLDMASLAEHPVPGRWEGNAFYLEIKSLNDLGNLTTPEAWGDFAGGAISVLAQTFLMELVPLVEFQYLRKTEVTPE